MYRDRDICVCRTGLKKLEETLLETLLHKNWYIYQPFRPKLKNIKIKFMRDLEFFQMLRVLNWFFCYGAKHCIARHGSSKHLPKKSNQSKQFFFGSWSHRPENLHLEST